MDDKTSSILQPSTTFDDSYLPTTHSVHRPLTNSTTYSSTPSKFLPSINQLVNIENKDIYDTRTTMLSPPEQTPHDTFARQGKSMDFGITGMLGGRGQAPLSPPISPATKLVNPDSPASVTSRDPILFPHQDQLAQSPLFGDSQRIVEEHITTREPSIFQKTSPPRRDEYELVLNFRSRVLEVYNEDRKLWARREMEQLRLDNMAKNGGRLWTPIAPANTRIRPAAIKPTGIVKPPKNRHASGPRATTKQPIYRGSTPESGKRVAREDKDFNSLPDFCPPVSSLPNKPNSLKVDWKGAPIDLRNDSHYHLLHPDEVALAANLRLDCATYLTSKRRIFMKRIDAYRIGKEFRKTDAQQACKIDVNKASKLWQAFEKVGWLQQKWIQKHVN